MHTPSAPSPIFLSHGSPMTALEPREAGAFMQRLGPAIDASFGRPRAVLAVSAHTLARAPVLLAGPRHEAVYDFGGFDDRLYTLRYDAAGAPQLATQVQTLLQDAGIEVQRVDQGGLDHGIWTPLRYLWPQADVPVLPLAFVPTWSPRQLFDFGAALAPLRGRLDVGLHLDATSPFAALAGHGAGLGAVMFGLWFVLPLWVRRSKQRSSRRI